MILKILQWNKWVKEDISKVAEYIKSLEADIVCLQELKVISKKGRVVLDEPKYISKYLRFYYSSSIAHCQKNNGFNICQSNAIFSRYQIFTRKWVFVQGASETISKDYSTEPRIALSIKISVKNKDINIVNTHLSYTNKFVETVKKITEENKFINFCNRFTKPLIICGDFNANESSFIVSELQRNYLNAGPDYSAKTWTTKPFSHEGFQADSLSWRLDHIFVSKDIKILSTKVLPTIYSDHLPIYCEVKI